jgi:hypothetical protein
MICPENGSIAKRPSGPIGPYLQGTGPSDSICGFHRFTEDGIQRGSALKVSSVSQVGTTYTPDFEDTYVNCAGIVDRTK